MIRGERVIGILAAGGSGQRAGVAKQWLVLGGESVLRRSARVLAACDAVDGLVVVVPPGDEARGEAELAGLGKPVRAVAGGPARADSVRNGLAAADGAVVLVHDAARPFASAALAGRVAEAAARDGAALAALPATDTVKRAEAGAEVPRVLETLDRRTVWLAQTPQGFRRAVLEQAYAAAGPSASAATDECALVEAAGAPVTLVPGEPGNFKITGPDDVRRARALLEAPVATGVGYDTHRFAPGRRLVLGGVEFEGDGLLGHSDADVCAHAIGDAILGAAGLGDLGRHFPDTDPRWKGVSSLALLREIAAKAAERGWRVGNCDVTLAAKRPKIAPRAEEMRARLAGALGISPAQVNVKATTGEGMGFVGREEGVAAHAIALLVRAAG
ncbi:2-C-methyl-D-erythritol 2,4-cyclodiphosphate synthase [Anaeromyxobacter dehalogenans]|uniref:Bifunctional enzyme IspD/IspF n=1 Tax=Anaeromyxobacter dehalogenans (strain 2CP-C) TaxID=290397 RepID=ISPDF_ANADE|nr:2-C-methyl-D-erythritol 2,4-cyclodiphosphate synthase [Anaeromyxobacter dehalogenans]Q2IQG8.1 RecName: Full=Bifunctional enzyme IspD/IspF; Includes: RecName: Full=2-C-methyl-D-erythritol 4-phosphate cytidylyltransferase; AltName: Full=4-diphosphocytidyl-2C-methyl-D-erythritol synthase; AltName: Full=MEP cytidylyltransferase; Short=MCT; Includes: RecName: Full=2-C-methyl-D-erythritol 2,4-cyclodiphosphate synthase; Short=MECDP-synthase; Short=MECPP-synthase; Short=MECPS [Anaeromyxobacter dehaloge